MQLTDQDIREFITLWKEEFGEEISEAEARRNATQLIQLYSLVVSSLPEGEESLESDESHPNELFSLLPKID